MTLLATFHHSHQINNFWFPRPQPRRCSQPARPPPNPPTGNPQTSLSTGDDGELDPITQSKTPKGSAGGAGTRGGQLSPNGREGCSGAGVGWGGGRGPGRPRAGSPRLFTRAARRGEPERDAGRGGGGGGCCVLALARPGPRATFVMSRGCAPLSGMTFLFFQRKEKRSTARFCIFILCENTQQKLFPPAQM